MQTKDRYVVLGIISLAVLAGLALGHGLEWIWVSLGWEDRPVFSTLGLTSLIGYAIALGGAIVCLKHPAIRQLANEVVEELSKVTWPTREETSNATVVVIVTVVICSAYLGMFDAFWLWLTDWILGVEKNLAS